MDYLSELLIRKSKEIFDASGSETMTLDTSPQIHQIGTIVFNAYVLRLKYTYITMYRVIFSGLK